MSQQHPEEQLALKRADRSWIVICVFFLAGAAVAAIYLLTHPEYSGTHWWVILGVSPLLAIVILIWGLRPLRLSFGSFTHDGNLLRWEDVTGFSIGFVEQVRAERVVSAWPF